MRLRSSFLSAFVLLSPLVACASDPECNSMFNPPVVAGTFDAASVPFRDASELLICLDGVCNDAVASRVTVRVDAPAQNPAFGSSGPAPEPAKVTVSYTTRDRLPIEPRTGSVLRLRYPKSESGPWSFDASLKATVTPHTRCSPTMGTFAL